ncbi:sugar 3,4-ketoisomerase [Dyadobacter sp. OTU695]|uniref:sugar 3,4-ketoisomerase n=1 Tax=Dyadobacter sp. OTU695 TaxID=3043860 RepID=UPI00313D3CC7
MARLINLKTFTDTRGSLTVIERVIPFEIKRIFYVNDPDQFKNGRKRMKQAVICLKGSCLIVNHAGAEPQHFVLNTADQCLLLAPEDRYELLEITHDAILMVLASELFELEERVHEPYQYELSLS